MQIPFETYKERYGTKYLALFHAIKDAIAAGSLPDGHKLPSSRELAASYRLSRGTVNQVYEMLAAEGYVSAGVGSGTYVTFNSGGDAAPRGGVPLRLSAWGRRVDAQPLLSAGGRRTEERTGGEGSEPTKYTNDGSAEWDAAERSISEGAEQGTAGLAESEAARTGAPMLAGPRPGGPGQAPRASAEARAAMISFESGTPDMRLFPAAAWKRCLYAEARELLAEPREEPFASLGHGPLREAIARYLRRERGIAAEAGDVAVTSGSMQALALLIQLLVEPGDAVVVENPGYRGIRRAIDAAGGRLLPVRVDSHGIEVSRWDARLAFVTPSRHFPTGAVLSLERRQQLLQWAEERGAIVVEDDYDSEFRHHGRPLEPLKALDRDGRVVYIGTFTKTMVPNLRLGYAVLPPGLLVPFAKAKQLFEPHPASLLEQRALAAFMNSGQYERHLRRMKRVYSRKYALLETLLREKLGGLFDIEPTDAGLHLFAWWKGSAERLRSYLAACERNGVQLFEGTASYAGDPRLCAVFGFSHLSEHEIREAVARMAKTAEGVTSTSCY
ncbi:PLP-dependent aminotransferase family protein [Paenibacillus contaminans]|uniref:PLP-dependent aminotransferase family protein n=1 Tax=Paenibacillus contaminans TaxID=450362 RepID=A0A329LXC9_9BACL|nr:PLP-dependent aminotransferase family protein [Paenibacillus contaminans]RAV09387.1 PLP-dependent aminotransferase family protein [Paenibacillus contaminans]